MSELTDLLSGKITGNAESISTLNERTPEIQKNVDLFTPICTTIDNQIVSIAASIVSLQNDIVTLSTNAYAVGCGTAVGLTTVYPDIVRTFSYNLCTPSYIGNAPYDVTSAILSSGNVGVGTFLLYTQNDSSQSGIGTLYAGISSCNRPIQGCTSGVCASYASSITAKQNEITSLRGQLVNLVSSSIKVKTERTDYEIQRYGNNYTVKILTDENIRISSAITTIQSYS